MIERTVRMTERNSDRMQAEYAAIEKIRAEFGDGFEVDRVSYEWRSDHWQVFVYATLSTIAS